MGEHGKVFIGQRRTGNIRDKAPIRDAKTGSKNGVRSGHLAIAVNDPVETLFNVGKDCQPKLTILIVQVDLFASIAARGNVVQRALHHLVHYELYDDMHAALQREKQLKKWKRAWKIRLLQERNPKWKDLYETLK